MKRFALIPALLGSLLLVTTCTKDSKNSAGPENSMPSSFYVITGRILDSGSGLPGVSVRLTGAGKDTTAITGSNGSYIFTNIPNGTYTLTPSKTDYVFDPPSAQSTVNEANTITLYVQAIVPDIQSLCLSFVAIPGGTFQMGDEEGIRSLSAAWPVHSVTVSGFEMTAYEITCAQFCCFLNAELETGNLLVGGNLVINKRITGFIEPWFRLDQIEFSNNHFTVSPGKDSQAVGNVSWYAAKAFADRYGLNLPREAEWEYACRGGMQYKYGTYDGTIDSNKANYIDSKTYGIKDVGSYPSNPYGLYDMSGNVWEWCIDMFGSYPSTPQTNPVEPNNGSGEYVLRGGSWLNNDGHCESCARFRDSASILDGHGPYGFRVVRRPGGLTY